MRSRSRSAKRSAVMFGIAAQPGVTGLADQPGPIARRASAALPMAVRGGSTAGISEAALPEPLEGPLGAPLDSWDSCALFADVPPVADAPSGRNGRGSAN